MNKITIVLSLVLLVLLVATFKADAQQQQPRCGERSAIVKGLKEKYKEVHLFVGVSDDNNVIHEVFLSSKGSWTMMVSYTNGKTCLIGSGKYSFYWHLKGIKS